MIEIFEILQNIVQQWDILSLAVLPFGTIGSDETARASDFINESERDATPSNDVGRVPKLESDGMLSHLFLNLQPEIVSGTTLSVTTDGNTKVLCVAVGTVSNGGGTNDTATLAYDGTTKHSITLVGSGITAGVERAVTLVFLETLPAQTANITLSGTNAGEKIFIIKLPG